MRGETMRRADHRQLGQISQPERLENETGEPLNPIVGWSIVLLISAGLWWCLWLAIASLV